MFEIGDVVQLKSLSPAMTVEAAERGHYSCVWFDDTFKVNRANFPYACVEAASSQAELKCPCDECGASCEDDEEDPNDLI